MRISDWSSYVCSSYLQVDAQVVEHRQIAKVNVPDVAPLALVVEHHAGLVLELVLPALRHLNVDQLVVLDLSLVGERPRADHADVQFQVVDLVAVPGAQADAGLGPAGVGAVVLDELALFDADRKSAV